MRSTRRSSLAAAGHVPYLSLAVGAARIRAASASKGWNLAGLKAAVAVAGPDAVDELAAFPRQVSHGASHIGVIAHVAALRGGGAGSMSARRPRRQPAACWRELLAAHLPEVRYAAPAGTYLAWLDCRALGLGEDPAEAFLRARARGAQLGTAVRERRRGTRAAQLRDLARDPHRGGGADGRGL